MQYKNHDGKVYEISYSQRLQAEDIKLKRHLLIALAAVVGALLIIIILFAMLLSGGTVTRLLHNVVC